MATSGTPSRRIFSSAAFRPSSDTARIVGAGREPCGAAQGLSPSLVVLAERLETVSVATLDERHFRAVRPLASGQAFRLLPMDR